MRWATWSRWRGATRQGAGATGVVGGVLTAMFWMVGTSRAADLLPADLPDEIAEAVLAAVLKDQLQAIAAQSPQGSDATVLKITDAQPRIWSDGCLALGHAHESCRDVFVRGWQVTVQGHSHTWVYRTSATGEQIRWDAAATHFQDAFPWFSVPIKPGASLPQSALFEMTVTPAGEATPYSTRLYREGQIVQQRGAVTERQGQRPAEVVQRFRDTLAKHQFGQFDQRGFQPSAGGQSQNWVTEPRITLRSQQFTTEYVAGDSARLPTDLQAILQAWESLIKGE